MFMRHEETVCFFFIFHTYRVRVFFPLETVTSNDQTAFPSYMMLEIIISVLILIRLDVFIIRAKRVWSEIKICISLDTRWTRIPSTLSRRTCSRRHTSRVRDSGSREKGRSNAGLDRESENPSVARRTTCENGLAAVEPSEF